MKSLDLNALEEAVRSSKGGRGDEKLALFRKNATSWKDITQVIDVAKTVDTRVFALSVLEGLVRKKWRTLPLEERRSCREYVLMKRVSAEEEEESENLSSILALILRHEWPMYWSDFIPTVVRICEADIELSEQGFAILTELAERVLNFEMRYDRENAMKKQLITDSSQVLELLERILLSENLENLHRSKSQESLVRTCLDAFGVFIVLCSSLDTFFLDELVSRVLDDFLQNSALCLCSFTFLARLLKLENENGVKKLSKHSVLKIYEQLNMFMVESQEENEVDFKRSVGECIVSLALHHRERLSPHATDNILQFLATRFSEANEPLLFKLWLGFWHEFSSIFVENHDFLELYRQPVSSVLKVLAFRVPAPKEVLFYYDLSGDDILVPVRCTESYTEEEVQIRDTLIQYAVAFTEEWEDFISVVLNEVSRGTEINEKYRAAFWGIGLVCGAPSLSSNSRRKICVQCIRDLLSLCEVVRGNSRRLDSASLLMYLSQQSSQFLAEHPKFLRTLVNKCFEWLFDSGSPEIVKLMASSTYLVLCSHAFAMTPPKLRNISSLLDRDDLIPMAFELHSSKSKYKLFQGFGYALRIGKAETTMEDLFEQVEQRIQRGTDLAEILDGISIYRYLSIGLNLSHPSGTRLLPTVIEQYITASEAMSVETPNSMRSKILEQIQIEVLESCLIVVTNLNHDATEFLSKLNCDIFVRYCTVHAHVRRSNVLDLAASVTQRLRTSDFESLRSILDNVLLPTLEMVGSDFDHYTEHWHSTLCLVQAMLKFHPVTFLCTETGSRVEMVYRILSLCKNTTTEISELADKTIFLLVHTATSLSDTKPSAFGISDWIPILQDLLLILTDGVHYPPTQYLLRSIYLILVSVDETTSREIVTSLNAAVASASDSEELSWLTDQIIHCSCVLEEEMFVSSLLDWCEYIELLRESEQYSASENTASVIRTSMKGIRKLACAMM